QKCLGGSGIDRPEDGLSFKNIIKQTTDKGFILAVTSGSNDGDVTGNHGSLTFPSKDHWIVKTDSIGDIQWQKSLAGTNYDVGNSVQQTSDGGYIVGGFVCLMMGMLQVIITLFLIG